MVQAVKRHDVKVAIMHDQQDVERRLRVCHETSWSAVGDGHQTLEVGCRLFRFWSTSAERSVTPTISSLAVSPTVTSAAASTMTASVDVSTYKVQPNPVDSECQAGRSGQH